MARKTKKRSQAWRDSPQGFDAAAYVEYLQSLAPGIRIESDDVARYEATTRIRDFVSSFTFLPDGQVVYAPPHYSELAWFAKRFSDYLKGSATLDESFGLKATKRGRGSAKEKLRLRDREIRARAIYVASMSRGTLSKLAISEVAHEMRCSEAAANSLIFRNRSQA